jgi:hypothetical protein
MYTTATLAVTMAVLATAILGSAAVTTAHASIPGNIGSGWDDGHNAAQAAYNSGQNYDSSCPRVFTDNISYCTAYHGGYYDEWSSLKGAHFNQSP